MQELWWSPRPRFRRRPPANRVAILRKLAISRLQEERGQVELGHPTRHSPNHGSKSTGWAALLLSARRFSLARVLRGAVVETCIRQSRRILGGSAEERSVRGQLPRWQCWLNGRLRFRLVPRYSCGRRFRFSSSLDEENDDLVRFAAILAPADLHRTFQL